MCMCVCVCVCVRVCVKYVIICNTNFHFFNILNNTLPHKKLPHKHVVFSPYFYEILISPAFNDVNTTLFPANR